MPQGVTGGRGQHAQKCSISRPPSPIRETPLKKQVYPKKQKKSASVNAASTGGVYLLNAEAATPRPAKAGRAAGAHGTV